MQIKRVLAKAREKLKERGFGSFWLDGDLILSHLLNVEREKLYSLLDESISEELYQRFFSLIKRREAGEPVAYIVEEKEFMGFSFKVGPNVLIPRPETEILVETALSYAEKMDRPAIVDVGAGCGAIAVSLSKLLRNHPKIYATDISERALKIAKQNAERLGAEIQFICCDVLSGIDLCVDIILSNPPYVQTEDIPRYEPKIALDGGADGLSLYPKIMEEARRLLKERGLLLLEVGFGQCSKVVEMAERYGFFTKIAKDLAGIERVIIASWTR